MNYTRGEKDQGFSLVELVIVIVIMAILIGVLAPAYLRYIEKSRKQTDETAAGEIQHAAEIVVLSGTYQLTDNQVLVTYSSAGVQVTASNAATVLETELEALFGGDLAKVVPVSNTYKAKTYTITIHEDPTGGDIPTISGAWN